MSVFQLASSTVRPFLVNTPPTYTYAMRNINSGQSYADNSTQRDSQPDETSSAPAPELRVYYLTMHF